MLQALRGGVKSPIMKVFLVFLAGGFALWGVGDMTTGLIGGSDKAITAGDESLSPGQVAVEFDRTRRNYLPNATMGEALQSGLLGEVAGSLARDVVFRAEAGKLGLTVTREMQRSEVANEPSFQDDTGTFSQSRFVGVLANAGLTEADYLERVNTALRREQIVEAVSAGAAQPEAVARALTAYELERRTARLVSVPVDANAIAMPTDEQLSTWFAEVKSRYDAPVLRSARVGSIVPQMFADTIEISDSEIESAYADRLDEFTTLEQRRVRQMVFEDMDTAQTAKSRVVAGEDFAAVANDLLGWTEDDITLGLVTKADLEGAVGEAVFGAASGELAGPAESVFGVHLLFVDDIIPGGETALDEVRDDIRNTLRMEAATDLIYDKVNELEDKIASGATLDEAFAAVNGTVVTIGEIDRRGNDINGIPVAGDAAELAQDSLVLETIWAADIDEIGVVEEGTDDMFFVVEVTGETDTRERGLDEVRDRAAADWQTVEAIKAAREAAEAITADAAAFDGAEPTADFRRNGIGLDHEAARLIASAVFAQGAGESRVVETGAEAIAVRTEDILPVETDELDTSARMISGVIANSMRQDVLNILARELSQTHDLQVRLGGVQQLLLGSQ
ncbi:MAG: SurA N-terminal domain-containing protein [Pseudomonadota bacterium]|nr:SurA N-terminal domain-containing protein [Pseudomonadota bacterium]MEC8672898.1 SurA N-terminal domain-containing protein [Pseudomonadota bacterium]